MENLGRKAAYVTAAFVSVAAVTVVYTHWEDISFELCAAIAPSWNRGEQRLSDAQGRRFTLLNHGDGKETALYDDHTAVTFHRDEAGNLIWEYGTASLLSSVAASYFAFHGFVPPQGHMEPKTMTYQIHGALQVRQEEEERRNYGSHTLGRGFGRGGFGSTINRNYQTEKSKKARLVGRKAGFGQAGVRSAGS